MNSYQDKVHQLIKDCGIFFAFAVSQYNEKIAEARSCGVLGATEKVVDIGMNGFCPKSKIDFFHSEMTRLNQEENDCLKNLSPDEKYKHIAHELRNHEAFFCDSGCDDAFDILTKRGFSRNEIMCVYERESTNS